MTCLLSPDSSRIADDLIDQYLETHRPIIDSELTRKASPTSRGQPGLAEHTALMNSIPERISLTRRSQIRHFLCFLEKHGISWSKLVPAGSVRETRFEDLEKVLKVGIGGHHPSNSTRAAIREVFDFELTSLSGPVRLQPTLTEHVVLMAGLPTDLNSPYRSCINRFLVHLEQSLGRWSQLVPAGYPTNRRPGLLEQAVNRAIEESVPGKGISGTTRAAINFAFGFDLQP
jgi:hypothetical protein